MSPATQVLLSGALTFGIPLAFAVRELVALRRWSDRGGGPGTPPPPAPAPMPPSDAPAMKPLPACLIPVRRARVLERV